MWCTHSMDAGEGILAHLNKMALHMDMCKLKTVISTSCWQRFSCIRAPPACSDPDPDGAAMRSCPYERLSDVSLSLVPARAVRVAERRRQGTPPDSVRVMDGAAHFVCWSWRSFAGSHLCERITHQHTDAWSPSALYAADRPHKM